MRNTFLIPVIKTSFYVFLCFTMNFIGTMRYIVVGDRELFGVIESTLEIGAFKTLSVVASSIVVSYSLDLPSKSNNKNMLEVGKPYLRAFISSGFCVAVGYMAFCMALMCFCPVSEKCAMDSIMIYHSDLAKLDSPLLIVLFYCLFIFGAGGFSGVLYYLFNRGKDKVVPLLTTYFIFLGMCFIGNITHVPNSIRFSYLYSGQFTLSKGCWIDAFWSILFFFLTGIPFILLDLALKQRKRWCE